MPGVTASYRKSLDFIAFFLGIYIHYWQPFMSELLFKTKLLQIAGLINVHIMVVNMLNVTAGYYETYKTF